MTDWTIGGNALGNPNPPQGVLGTTDANALVIETGGTERLRVDPSGKVGIGTSSPQKPLDVAASGGIRIGQTGEADTANEIYFADNGQIRSLDENHRIIFNRSGNELEFREYGTITLSPGATQGQRTAKVVVDATGYITAPGINTSIVNTGSVQLTNWGISGNVGIALTNQDVQTDGEPKSSLVVHGDIRTIYGGNVSVSGDVLLTGADCAEEFDLSDTQPPDPGTVVVIGSGETIRESQDAYDKKVAGVVSGAGEYRHGLVLDRRASKARRIPVALVGKVYCKVDAEYSPIEVGDLLTTSATPGHAMKAKDAAKAFGSVLGKALRALSGGKGLIPILIALQ